MSSKVPSEQQIRQAIDTIFRKYDIDKSGTLDFTEVKTVVNDAFRNSGCPRNITEEDIKKFVSSVDANSDGSISQEELFLVFKKLILESQTRGSISF
jgi:Ca2+-binding EF-hand superfamily protein